MSLASHKLSNYDFKNVTHTSHTTSQASGLVEPYHSRESTRQVHARLVSRKWRQPAKINDRSCIPLWLTRLAWQQIVSPISMPCLTKQVGYGHERNQDRLPGQWFKLFRKKVSSIERRQASRWRPLGIDWDFRKISLSMKTPSIRARRSLKLHFPCSGWSSQQYLLSPYLRETFAS